MSKKYGHVYCLFFHQELTKSKFHLIKRIILLSWFLFVIFFIYLFFSIRFAFFSFRIKLEQSRETSNHFLINARASLRSVPTQYSFKIAIQKSVKKDCIDIIISSIRLTVFVSQSGINHYPQSLIVRARS